MAKSAIISQLKNVIEAAVKQFLKQSSLKATSHWLAVMLLNDTSKLSIEICQPPKERGKY